MKSLLRHREGCWYSGGLIGIATPTSILSPSMPSKPKTSRRPSLSPEHTQLAATFRLAAEVMNEVPLSSWRGCCYALSIAEGTDPIDRDYSNSPGIKALVALLAPPTNGGWWYADEGPALNNVGTRHARIIGLILCALLIEDNAVPLAGL